MLVHDQVALPSEMTVDHLGDSNESGKRRVDKWGVQYVQQRAYQPDAGGEEGEAAMQQGTNAGAVAWPVLCWGHYYDQKQSKEKHKYTDDACKEAGDYTGRERCIWEGWVAMEVGGV